MFKRKSGVRQFFSRLSRGQNKLDKRLFLTGPGSRKLINLWRGQSKLFAIGVSDEASIEQFATWGAPLHNEWRAAFLKIADACSGRLTDLAVNMANADDFDMQLFDCEAIKIVQFKYNNDKRYKRDSQEPPSDAEEDIIMNAVAA